MQWGRPAFQNPSISYAFSVSYLDFHFHSEIFCPVLSLFLTTSLRREYFKIHLIFMRHLVYYTNKSSFSLPNNCSECDKFMWKLSSTPSFFIRQKHV